MIVSGQRVSKFAVLSVEWIEPRQFRVQWTVEDSECPVVIV